MPCPSGEILKAIDVDSSDRKKWSVKVVKRKKSTKSSHQENPYSWLLRGYDFYRLNMRNILSLC